MAGTVVLGAGPAGLTAAYFLARSGHQPVVLESASVPGGLMRSVKRGSFSVDVGRKELYSRIRDVDALWTELLGASFRPYPHRVGVLYQGCIIERTRSFRGFRRGMPWRLMVPAAADYVFRQARNPFLPSPQNEQEYRYRKRGKRFSVILSQGYNEKFSGERWQDRPPPMPSTGGQGLIRRAVGADFGPRDWRHPARGTGQIIELLERRTRECGGQFVYGASVVGLRTEGRQVKGVVADVAGERREWPADHVVSSVPLPVLAGLLGVEAGGTKASEENRRSTMIVYLFLDQPARFEHAWLDVTCPAMRAGRITNYSGFGGEMVPEGAACLGVEYFTVGRDPVVQMDDGDLFDLAVGELGRAGLIDTGRVCDHLVLRFPGAYASEDYRSWLRPDVQRLLHRIRVYRNLFEVARAGTDVATYAGLEAARAIEGGDRASFDDRADPARAYGIETALSA